MEYLCGIQGLFAISLNTIWVKDIPIVWGVNWTHPSEISKRKGFTTLSVPSTGEKKNHCQRSNIRHCWRISRAVWGRNGLREAIKSHQLDIGKQPGISQKQKAFMMSVHHHPAQISRQNLQGLSMPLRGIDPCTSTARHGCGPQSYEGPNVPQNNVYLGRNHAL